MRTVPVLAAVALAGCATPEFHAHNLRELHEADGSTKFVGHTLSALGWATRKLDGFSFFKSSDEPRFVKDPYSLTLEHLNGLAGEDPDNPVTAGLQVQFFGWLAEQDDYTLARERAVLELGRAAERLQIHRPLTPLAAEEAVTPDVVERALGRIQDVAYFAVSGEIAPDSAAGQLRAACEEVGALALDREGMRRALDFCTILVGAEREGLAQIERAQLIPLFELHEQLQRDYVATALQVVLEDPQPIVVAAAIRTVYALPGIDHGQLLSEALEHPVRLVAVAGLDAIAEHGLPPAPEGFSAEQRAQHRELWLERLVIMTRDLDGRLAARACAVLELVTDSGLRSLQPEVWRSWWIERKGRAIQS